MKLTKLDYCLLVILLIVIFIIGFYNYTKNQNHEKNQEQDMEKFNDDVLTKYYHDNVVANDRSFGYEISPTTTTGSGSESGSGSISAADALIENSNGFVLTDKNRHYYQFTLNNKPTIYGIRIKIKQDDSNSLPTKLEVKYSTDSLSNKAFMPILTNENTQELLSNNGDGNLQVTNQELPYDDIYFTKPIQAKYIRLYSGTGTMKINVDVILKPQHFFSIRLFSVSKTKTLATAEPTGTTYVSKDINVGEKLNYVSHIDNDTPLHPYSDKLGKREIFDLRVTSNDFDFSNIGITNSPTFDAYILRSVMSPSTNFCYINPDDKKMYCDSSHSSSNNVIRFHASVIDDSEHSDGLDTSDNANQKIMLLQDFKSGLYADETFTFKISGHSNAAKFIIEQQTKDTIKNILNVDDYIDNSEKEAEKDYKDCQDETIKYVILRRPYNLATIAKEHASALMNRNNQLPKEIKFKEYLPHAIPTSSDYYNGIFVHYNDTSKDTDVIFRVADGDNDGKDIATFYRYKSYDSSSLTVEEKGAEPLSNNEKYIYHSIRINNAEPPNIKFNIDTDTYKPEIYEGMKINNKYVSNIKKHIPTSHKSYTPEIIKICIPKDLFDNSGDINTFYIKTTLFDIVDDEGNAIPVTFKVNNDTHLFIANCRDSSKVNNMYKIKKQGDIFPRVIINENQPTTPLPMYEILKPDDKENKTIDCGCNCLQDIDQVQEYRKSNNFVKSVLNNLMQKTDDVLSRRNKEITEIETEERSLLEQQHVKDFGEHESNYLLDTNEYVVTDEIQNYYKVKGQEGFSDTNTLSPDLKSLSEEFYGMYKILPGQFLMLDETTLQIDSNFIGFISNNVPIYKFKYDKLVPFYSPYQSFEGVKARLIMKDKMVHTIENANLETLFQNIGLSVPNFIYISKYMERDEHGLQRTYYKFSNREYTTLMQMEKL